jgi:nicotinamidase/pyrazinamidase
VEQYEVNPHGARKVDQNGQYIKKMENGKVVWGPIPPFTTITHEDIKNGLYTPRCLGTAEEKEALIEHCLWYTRELEIKGRFQLCIWPEHCRIGTKGQAIVPILNDALTEWCTATGKALNFVNKTESHMTEMYSALEAEVVMPDDETTMLNKDLLSRLTIADQLLVCGEAKSHCVNYTTRDIAKHWHKEKNRICILTDGCSSVPGPLFEAQGEKFLKDMEKDGCTLTTTQEAFDLFIGKNLIRDTENADL